MKVVLLGGAGAQGSVMLEDLSKVPYITEIICADMDLEKSTRLATNIKNVTPIKIDATNSKEILEISRGAKVIVNLLSPRFNLSIMKIACEVGANYQDLAGIIDIITIASKYNDEALLVAMAGIVPTDIDPNEFLNYEDKIKQNGITALIHTGSAPGLTNILAKECSEKLDSVEEIRIRNYSRTEIEKFILFWWDPKTAWNDMSALPLFFENQKFRKVGQFEGREQYPFPKLGLREVVHHLHEEVATLPKFIGKGIQYTDFKYGGPHIDIAEAAFKLGFLDTDPIKVKNQWVTPRDVLVALTPNPPVSEEIKEIVSRGIKKEEKGLVVEVIGIKDGLRFKYIAYVTTPNLTEASKRIENATALSYLTGLSASAFTKLLIEDKINQTGIIAPECLDQQARANFLTELSSKDITIHITHEQLS